MSIELKIYEVCTMQRRTLPFTNSIAAPAIIRIDILLSKQSLKQKQQQQQKEKRKENNRLPIDWYLLSLHVAWFYLIYG